MLYSRSPIRMLASLAITLALGGVALWKVNGATHSADKVQQEARRLDQLSQGGLGSSLVIPANLARAVRQLTARLGPQTRLLEVTVNASSAEFQYLIGQRAAGYLETSETSQLQPEQVTLSGDG